MYSSICAYIPVSKYVWHRWRSMTAARTGPTRQMDYPAVGYASACVHAKGVWGSMCKLTCRVSWPAHKQGEGRGQPGGGSDIVVIAAMD